MPLIARALALLVALIPLSAFAATDTVPWGEIEVPYDRSEWIVTSADDGKGLVFLCVAADCPRYARLFASIVTGGGQAEEPAWRGPKPIALDSPRLPFLAYELWSGCRAGDAPVLSAALLFRGNLYRLSSTTGAGCNFEPQVPSSRFTRLVEGVRPRDMRAFAIGGIRIAYDAGRWEMRSGGGGSLPAGAWFACIHRDCRQWPYERPSLRISAVKDDGGDCVTPAEPDDGFGRDGGTRTFGGLSLRLWTRSGGCRALAPSELNACGRHAGVLYRFTSGFASGCGGVWGVPEPMFEELLSGISLPGGMPASP